MIDELRQTARELLGSQRVDLIIGYQRASDGTWAVPAFVFDEADVDRLIWDAYCTYNLSAYLRDFPGKKTGIVAKACDVRAIVVLIQENQRAREDVFVIGVECSGVVDEKGVRLAGEAPEEAAIDQKCRVCGTQTPLLYDVLISAGAEAGEAQSPEADVYEAVRKLEQMSLEERRRFWEEEFSTCVRCYACRQICPLCYCQKCVADQAVPHWFSKAPTLPGNLSWNITRAMHLAGRCVDCCECERACPVGIPLREINRKIQKDVKELFDYEAGVGTDQIPLLASFDKDDTEDFIR